MSALYIVVRHARAADQAYANSWADEDTSTRLTAIMTTAAVAQALREADAAGKPVRVHRCAWSGGEAEVVCELALVRAVDLGAGQAMAEFTVVTELSAEPPRPGTQGENYYWA